MKKLYEEYLDLEEKKVDLVMKGNENIKEVVAKMIEELDPELTAICEKIGIKDDVGFKKSMCIKMMDAIKDDSQYALSTNRDKEIVSRKNKIISKMEKARNTYL